MLRDSEISNFWAWFVKHHGELQFDDHNPDTVDQLEVQVVNWEMGWQLGPGTSSKYAFTLIPNGDPDLLLMTKRVISCAPEIENWEFHSARQANEDWAQPIDPEGEININGANWKFTYSSETSELKLEAKDIQQLDEDSQHWVIDLVLTHLLGEELKIRRIESIQLIKRLPEGQLLERLKEQLS